MRRASRVPRGDAVGLVGRIVVSLVVIGCGGGGRAAGAMRKLLRTIPSDLRTRRHTGPHRVCASANFFLRSEKTRSVSLLRGIGASLRMERLAFQLGHTLAKLVLRRSELRRGDERDAALAAADDRQEPGQGAAAVALRQDRALRGGRPGARGGPGPRPRPDAARPRLSPEAQSSSRGSMGEARRVPIGRSLITRAPGDGVPARARLAEAFAARSVRRHGGVGA